MLFLKFTASLYSATWLFNQVSASSSVFRRPVNEPRELNSISAADAKNISELMQQLRSRIVSSNMNSNTDIDLTSFDKLTGDVMTSFLTSREPIENHSLFFAWLDNPSTRPSIQREDMVALKKLVDRVARIFAENPSLDVACSSRELQNLGMEIYETKFRPTDETGTSFIFIGSSLVKELGRLVQNYQEWNKLALSFGSNISEADNARVEEMFETLRTIHSLRRKFAAIRGAPEDVPNFAGLFSLKAFELSDNLLDKMVQKFGVSSHTLITNLCKERAEELKNLILKRSQSCSYYSGNVTKFDDTLLRNIQSSLSSETNGTNAKLRFSFFKHNESRLRLSKRLLATEGERLKTFADFLQNFEGALSGCKRSESEASRKAWNELDHSEITLNTADTAKDIKDLAAYDDGMGQLISLAMNVESEISNFFSSHPDVYELEPIDKRITTLQDEFEYYNNLIMNCSTAKDLSSYNLAAVTDRHRQVCKELYLATCFNEKHKLSDNKNLKFPRTSRFPYDREEFIRRDFSRSAFDDSRCMVCLEDGIVLRKSGTALFQHFSPEGKNLHESCICAECLKGVKEICPICQKYSPGFRQVAGGF